MDNPRIIVEKCASCRQPIHQDQGYDTLGVLIRHRYSIDCVRATVARCAAIAEHMGAREVAERIKGELQ